MKNIIKNKVIIYQAKDGAIELKGDFSKETIWATLDQIAEVFERDKSVISRHLRNIYNEGELNQSVTVAKNATVQIEGNRRVERIATNYEHFLRIVEDVKKLLPSPSASTSPTPAILDNADIIDLITLFADTWLSLGAYDRYALPKGKLTKKKVAFTTDKITTHLSRLRIELISKSQATEIFGKERNAGSVAGIVGNVMQSFAGKELYGSIEEKAAHLLYFMVKNHPFIDGNKRSGAFAFVWFLKQANILDVSKLTPSALTALTILVASSDPKDKEKIVSLILNILAK